MSGEVRAVVHAATPGDGGPGHLRAVGRPAPVAGHGQAVVEVHAALLRPGAAPPLVDGTVVGTAAAGVVAAVGTGVGGLQVGDAVTLPALVTCGTCGVCRAGRANLCPARQRPGIDVDGWLAERVVVPAGLLVSAAATVPAALAASVPGIVADAYHALKRAGVGPDVSVAVVGADALGLHVTQLAALAGGVVTTLDDRPAARERAADLGADEVLTVGDRALTDVLVEPVDRLFVRGPQPLTAAAAARVLAPGGRLVVLDSDDVAGDVPMPTDLLVRRELDVVGATGSTPEDVVELLDLAAEGRLILHTAVGGRFTVSELGDAEAALGSDEDGLLVVVDPR
ncbi:alcohol dehydrogenase catalytic domain-containing protein [Nitriliruptor alkaliphilus]|uniref:alcohol dehydrogenase catalytic domain-containing protein n=1 Tax=Nitriliruptor alkaliphilus TaxID=427918 RepID=UPI000698DDCF|nr:alcohol dehydrogenase catalytic domain-containing protein [Nitriliruptor alkaliphilus]